MPSKVEPGGICRDHHRADDGRLIVRQNLESRKRPGRAIKAIVALCDEDAEWLFRCTAWTPQEAMGAWRSLASACLMSTPDWFS